MSAEAEAPLAAETVDEAPLEVAAETVDEAPLAGEIENESPVGESDEDEDKNCQTPGCDFTKNRKPVYKGDRNYCCARCKASNGENHGPVLQKLELQFIHHRCVVSHLNVSLLALTQSTQC